MSIGLGPLTWPYAAAWLGPAAGATVSVILAVRLQNRTAKILLVCAAVMCGLVAGLIFVVGMMAM